MAQSSWSSICAQFSQISYCFKYFFSSKNIYVLSLVTLATLIKATNYLLLHQALPLPLHLRSSFLMFGPPSLPLLMVFTTTLFLLTITQSIFGFTLYIDNGGEFLALRSFLATHGISHLTTPPHTLEHDGYSERRYQHIVETGLALLHQASIPLTFWSYAFTMAVYLINRMPKVGISLASSFERLFNKSPDLSKLCVFGCLCFPWLCPYSSHKLDLKSNPCVFLDYSLTQSVFLCFDPTLNKFFVSHHVKFMETIFPFASPPT